MTFTVTVDLTDVKALIQRLGLEPNGDAQQFLTSEVNRRMTRYMPYRSGALSTKKKIISGPDEITVMGPYAGYQYYGMAMAGPAPRYVTNNPLHYDTSKNPLAGPYWDRRLMAAEGKQIAEDLAEYITRRNQK